MTPKDPPAADAPPPPPPRKRRSAWKRFLRRTGTTLARVLGPLVIRLLASTWRVRFVNLEARDRRDARGHLPVYAFWHQNILTAVGTHFGFPVRVLVSLHRDGETIARLAERLGYRTVRGSSFGGGPEALREMTREAMECSDGYAFTPDGPRGPARSLAPGVIVMAANTGRALTASGFAFSSCWQAGSWDRQVLPKPFARVVVAFEALEVPGSECGRPGAAFENMRVRYAAAMDAAEQRARAALEEWSRQPAAEIARR